MLTKTKNSLCKNHFWNGEYCYIELDTVLYTIVVFNITYYINTSSYNVYNIVKSKNYCYFQ